MISTDPSPNKNESYEVQMGRYRQALHIGYVEMERIVEEIIVSEFTRIGELLMENGYEVEVTVFDTESELTDMLSVCGAGLRFSRGYMKNAIVYTGDPHYFQFVLQTQNFASRTTEESVEYHELTPKWFYKHVKNFLESSCREIDFSHIEKSFADDWEMYEGPFSVKMKNSYGYYNQIATAETIEEAFHLGSTAVQGDFSEEDLLVVDKNGREVQ